MTLDEMAASNQALAGMSAQDRQKLARHREAGRHQGLRHRALDQQGRLPGADERRHRHAAGQDRPRPRTTRTTAPRSRSSAPPADRDVRLAEMMKSSGAGAGTGGGRLTGRPAPVAARPAARPATASAPVRADLPARTPSRTLPQKPKTAGRCRAFFEGCGGRRIRWMRTTRAGDRGKLPDVLSVPGRATPRAPAPGRFVLSSPF